ncbi:MAG: hypothetical protein LC136_15475 [Burkholderiales bacterium]|nr:hypothetical protein [Burkholderiales bacterium]
MGMMDRDWYQEHWQRNVLGLDKPKGDPTGEPARLARRLARARRVPAGAGPGKFWWRLYWALCAVAFVALALAKLRG